MKYTFKDLKEGRCALENNGSEFIEWILREAFPEDPNSKGEFNPYLEFKHFETSLINSRYYTVGNETSLPIISPEQLLLNEAELRYPVGTEFRSAYSHERDKVKNKNYKSDHNAVFGDRNIVYYRGKWAEIISKEVKMYPKGSYVVLIEGLDGPDKPTGWSTMPLNYCYKLTRDSYEDHRGFSVEKSDSTGSDDNGWWANEGYNKSCKFRYATPEEIQEYQRRGKPYHTVLFKTINDSRKAEDIRSLIEDSVLPEKWYCEVTEDNLELCKEWQRLQPDFDKSYNEVQENDFVVSKYDDNSYYFCGPLIENVNYFKDHIEIYTEQLQQIVNNKKKDINNTSIDLLGVTLESQEIKDVLESSKNNRVKPLPLVEVKKRF